MLSWFRKLMGGLASGASTVLGDRKTRNQAQSRINEREIEGAPPSLLRL